MERTLITIWNKIQQIQTDFAIAQELTYYYTSPEWHHAKKVLDLGTGNGYYLRQIACRFPEKNYHGVDISEDFIAIAEKEAAGGTVSFSQRGLLDVTGAWDFVLMRLLLQHVEDVEAVLEHVADLTLPGGTALIIDAHDSRRYFHPPLPEFMDFFAAYAEHERKGGRDRCVAERVQQAIGSTVRWRLGDTLQLLIPSTITGNLDLFTETYALFVELVEQIGELEYDFATVKQAWRRWTRRADAYTHVGLKLMRIDRV